MNLSWGWLVRTSAGVSAALALGRGIAVVDRESIAIGAALAVCTALTFVARPGLARLGWLGTALLFVNQGAWMIAATWSLSSSAPSIAGALFPAVLAVAAALGIVASVARARDASAGSVLIVATGAVVLALLLTVAIPAAGAGAGRARQGDLIVYARDTKFEPDTLTAEAGDIGVVFRNDDLFWHTFTISDLDANVTVATAGRRRLAISDVAPGVYAFVCAIPGHESAGMKGTLTVR